MTRDEAVPVEDAGDKVIVGDQHELANSGDHVGRSAVALTAAASGQTHFAVDTTGPMDHEHDLGRFGVDVGHHLLDYGAHDALLQPCVGRGSRPDGLEVRRQRSERCRINGGRGHGLVVSGDLALDLRNTPERLVPARLQLARYQPVGRVGGIVLPKRAVGRIARRLKIAL